MREDCGICMAISMSVWISGKPFVSTASKPPCDAGGRFNILFAGRQDYRRRQDGYQNRQVSTNSFFQARYGLTSSLSLGEQLETLHHFRSLAQSVSLLLSYYLSVANPPAPVQNPDGTETTPQTPLEILFATRSSRDGRTKLAVILRRLTALAKDVAENAAAANLIHASSDEEEKTESVSKADLEKAENIRAEVSNFAEQFEKECLRLFDKSYKKGDIKMMAVCHFESYLSIPAELFPGDKRSTVQGHCRASMAEHHASRCMSTSMTSLSARTGSCRSRMT